MYFFMSGIIKRLFCLELWNHSLKVKSPIGDINCDFYLFIINLVNYRIFSWKLNGTSFMSPNDFI